jgi:hypothetical protein
LTVEPVQGMRQQLIYVVEDDEQQAEYLRGVLVESDYPALS